MKRNLLLCILSIFICSQGFSQAINHIDFGDEGLAIGMNDNFAMDVNDDGVVDFHVNAWDNELGFSPIFAIGCFASESYTANTAWGSKVLQIFQEGEVLSIDGANMYDYIDDDRGSTYQSGTDPAEGWVNGQSNYIGFAIFNANGDFAVTNGWMLVELDTDNEQLIIHEYAYHDWVEELGVHSIVIGDRGLVNVQNLDNVLLDVSISPNPASDFISIDYNFLGEGNISVSVYDNIGKEVIQASAIGQSRLVFNSSSWTNGIYFVNFNTSDGVHSERVMISH